MLDEARGSFSTVKTEPQHQTIGDSSQYPGSTYCKSPYSWRSVSQSVRLGIEQLVEFIDKFKFIFWRLLAVIVRSSCLNVMGISRLSGVTVLVGWIGIHTQTYVLLTSPLWTVFSVFTVHSMHTTYPASFSLGLAQQIMPYLNKFCWNGSSDILWVVQLKADTFHAPYLISRVSPWKLECLRHFANILILLISYDFCLLSAWFRNQIIYKGDF